MLLRMARHPSSEQYVVFDIVASASKTSDFVQTHGPHGWVRNLGWAKDESALYIVAEVDEGRELLLKLDLATQTVTDDDIGRGSNVWDLTTVFRSRTRGEH